MSRRLTAALPLLLFAWAGPASAQWGLPPPSGHHDPLHDSDLDGLQALARARFEADQADPADLARARAQAARIACRDRRQQNLAGRGTYDLYHDSILRRWQAELAVVGAEGAAGVTERAWREAREFEETTDARFAAGRISTVDLGLTRDLRLRLQLERGLLPRAGSVTGPLDDFLSRDKATPSDPLDYALQVARFQVEAAQSTRADLLRARVELARENLAQWLDLYAHGWAQPFHPRESLERLYQAERAAAGGRDTTAFLERLWRRTREIEETDQRRYEVGRVSVSVRDESRCLRLELQAALIRARRAGPAAPSGFGGDPRFGEADPLDNGRDVARALFDADRTSLKELARARFEAAREAYVYRLWELRNGRGTLDLTLTAARRLFDAERDLAGERGLAPALERHWRRVWEIDTITEGRHHMGRVSNADFADARGLRLEVEIELARFRKR
jgi:hypothetical protein